MTFCLWRCLFDFVHFKTILAPFVSKIKKATTKKGDETTIEKAHDAAYHQQCLGKGTQIEQKHKMTTGNRLWEKLGMTKKNNDITGSYWQWVPTDIDIGPPDFDINNEPHLILITNHKWCNSHQHCADAHREKSHLTKLSQAAPRVAKCHRYGRYICVK